MPKSPLHRRRTACAAILPVALALGVLAAPASAAPQPRELELTTALPQVVEDGAAVKAPTSRSDKRPARSW